MSKPAPSARPPRPPLALNVGVTGHRPDRLQSADPREIAETMESILDAIAQAVREFAETEAGRAAYDLATPPAMRLLSSLAEGADRIAARAALKRGYELRCPLPFEAQDYVRDFPDSRKEFDDLLGQAHAVLALDGTRARTGQAYLQAGLMVLAHADLLLAVRDGLDDEGAVGTSPIVAEARRKGVPIIQVDAAAPHAWALDLGRTGAPEPAHAGEGLAALVEQRLLPPPDLRPPATPPARDRGLSARLRKWCRIEEDTRLAYLAHRPPRGNLWGWGWVYQAFFTLFGKRSLKLFGAGYWEGAEVQWRVIEEAARHLPEDRLGESVRGALQGPMRAQFLWADSLASYYADEYRGTFILAFGLTGLAVLCAVLSGPFKVFPDLHFFARVELVLILVIGALIGRGVVRDLHRRWLDLRLLAERLRQYAFVLPLGRGVDHLEPPCYEAHCDRAYLWINWLVRAVGRAQGMPAGSIGPGYRAGYARFLAADDIGRPGVLTDQAGYHERNEERNHRIAALLEGLNVALLVCVVAACLVHIILSDSLALAWATVAAAALPAFGAAGAGLLHQGEYERIASRSQGMAERLRVIAGYLRGAPELPAAELAQEIDEAVSVMSQELSDWRVLFRAKPLEMHA